MTNAAERQQALTGKTWGLSDAASRSELVSITYVIASIVDVAAAATFIGLSVKYSALASAADAFVEGTAMEMLNTVGMADAFVDKWGGLMTGSFGVAIGLTLIILGGYGISTWYNYYNPDYTEIPNTMVDVKNTDVGDKYVKYTAAKVYGDKEGKNADFNAYEGKEWIALYYTKDAIAGNSLTPNFSFSETSATVARRYQGVSMFGETNAYNLNSHVYSKNAKGAYLTVRYSNTKKAAANTPGIVASIFGGETLYLVVGSCGLFVGAASAVAVSVAKKKKKEESVVEVQIQE